MKSILGQHLSDSVTALVATYGNGLRLVFCASGICCCYSFYGFLQEKILSQSDLGATFILVLQSIVNIVVALLWFQVEGGAKEKKLTGQTLNHQLLFLTSTTYVIAMVGSNEALRFVPYPTAVLAKSCKLIPNMTMGWALEKKQYGLQQWISALLISFGIAVFSISRIKEAPAMSHGASHDQQDDIDEYWKGMFLLMISLAMDGFLGVSQGFLKRKDTRERNQRPPTAVETMLWLNIYAMLLLVPMAIADDQMNEGVQLLYNDRILLRSIILLNSVVGVGQIFIFLTITWYSSLICTTITTTRKFFTILFSVFHFGHHFSSWQWVSTCMVFCGIYLSIFPKKTSKQSNEGDQAAVPTGKKED